MDQFDYKNFNGDESACAFTEEKGYTDPTSEETTRRQLSYPLFEIRKHLNEAMPIKSSDNKVVQLGVSSQNRLMYRSVAGGTWTDIAGGIPYGGTKYRAIIKASGTDYDVAWGMPSYVGMVIMNTFSSEADVKAVYGSNTSWTKLSSVILASEHVFGNGYALGLTSGSNDDPKRYGLKYLTSTANRLTPGSAAYGSTLNSGSSATIYSPANAECVGVITKERIESDVTEETPKYDYSGLKADTETVYTWKRTA